LNVFQRLFGEKRERRLPDLSARKKKADRGANGSNAVLAPGVKTKAVVRQSGFIYYETQFPIK